MELTKEEISVKGKSVMADALRVGSLVIIVEGRFVRIARIKEEWYEDIDDPEETIKALKNSRTNADIFTFWQRLPETGPRYPYFMEWDDVAAIAIKSFDDWLGKKIDAKTRNLIRKAEKKGVVVKSAKFTDEFVKGMTEIFNETPIRQGKPFWHYGKDFETVKREFSRNLYREELIGAYYGDELIGFAMLGYAGKYAETGAMLSKIKHRDKSPNNALFAKAVEVCAKKQVPYLTYGPWRRGSLSDFLISNGFEKISLPRYYIPLSVKGKIIMKLNLHHELIDMIPKNILNVLLNLRKKIYERRYGRG